MSPDRDPQSPAALSLSDEDLMARVAVDDQRAFTELVRRFQGRVTNLISRVLNDRECADDLAQEVFVRVFVHRRNYRHGAKFSTWLFTIAANLAKNEIRRRVRRRNWFSLDALQEMLHDSATRYFSGTVAMVLRDIEGLAYEEIATVLGIPGGTVRSRINRARSMLKRKLQPLLRKAGSQ